MASRTSARTAAMRNQASSPPRQSPQTPIARRTRTRSASVELDNAASTAKRGKRAARQGSVESVGSNVSLASSNRGERRKRATRGVIANPELSMVAENSEDDKEEEGEEEEEEEVGEEEPGRNPGSRPNTQSPGGLSQISGTTAISGQTSHTTAEVARLDTTMVLEVLPDLLTSSFKLLALLAPISASKEWVEDTVRELKVPGSELAKRLKIREERFGLDKEKFGTDEYIRTSFILQKLFSSEVELETPRPDAILQAANVTTLVKGLLVSPKESPSTFNFFSTLDTWFPQSFVTQFEDNVSFGNSRMLEKSYEMALDIRTQYTIIALLYHKGGEQEWHPDEVLTELFFNPPIKRTRRLSHFDDVMQNGQIKSLMRAGPNNTEEQDAMIRKQVLAIRESFRKSEDAAQAGDLVDFDYLEVQFPWSAFLAKIVQWSRSRLEEIAESIQQQGGVDNLIALLVEAIKNNDSQTDLIFEPFPSTMAPRQLLPPANILPSPTGYSLATKRTVRAMEKIKQASSAPTSDQARRKDNTSADAAASTSSRPGPSRTRATGPLEPAEQPRQASDDEEMVDEPEDRRALSTWEAYHREVTDKENTPQSHRQKNVSHSRFIDEQPNARKVQWSSQDSAESQQNVASPSKRKRAQPHGDDESDSHDEGFEADRRDPDPERRMVAPVAIAGRNSSTAPIKRSPKRARVQVDERAGEEDERAVQAAHRRQHSQPQPRVRPSVSARLAPAEESLNENDDEDMPRPSATQVAASARVSTALAKRQTAATQSRTPWSEADTEHLIDLITEIGTSWSEIQKAGEFEVERDQVALKDKARNLKVLFLKGNLPLPLNFERVALGRKEIMAVRVSRPDYEP